MPLWSWSKTANNNSNADPTINYEIGMAPFAVGSSARSSMAAVAQYRDDIAGSIVTTGTSTAYIVASNSGFDTLAHLNGQVLAFQPHTTNGATVTLNVDGLGAKPLRSAPGVELQSGTIIQGTPYLAFYNNTDGAFYLQGFYGNPYNVPLAAGMDYWASTAPNSSFAFPVGQAISRTTYSALFALFGTFYGTGDGSTTFNIPDKRGYVTAASDNMGGSSAGRISLGFGVTGGTQTETLSQSNLPNVSLAAPTISDSRTWGVTSANGSSLGDQSASSTSSNFQALAVGAGSAVTPAVTVTGGAISASTIPLGGSNTAFSILQPTIACNYILRII